MTLFLENVRLALFSLKANKMRAVLTMLGIIIGIASVITIITIGNAMKKSIGNIFTNLGSNNITVYLDRMEVEQKTSEDGLRFHEEKEDRSMQEKDSLTREQIEEYVNTYSDSIRAIGLSRTVASGALLEIGKEHITVDVKGATLGQLVCDSREIIAGRFFTKAEVDNNKHVAIVSSKVVDKLFDGDNELAIGSTANVEGQQYTIVGVYKDDQGNAAMAMMGGSSATTAYIPYTTAVELTHNELIFYFYVLTKEGVDQQKFANTTEQYFKAYYRNNDTFKISAFSSEIYVEMFQTLAGTAASAFAAIASIALLVGGIGVMNIMLVSITERTREIGIRKSLGAPNSSIRMQFIVEAVVICLIGGGIGMLLGIGAGGLIAKNVIKVSASPSIGSIIGSLVFSMAIGVFFGFYPANKAAKMDPIDALRYE